MGLTEAAKKFLELRGVDVSKTVVEEMVFP